MLKRNEGRFLARLSLVSNKRFSTKHTYDHEIYSLLAFSHLLLKYNLFKFGPHGSISLCSLLSKGCRRLHKEVRWAENNFITFVTCNSRQGTHQGFSVTFVFSLKWPLLCGDTNYDLLLCHHSLLLLNRRLFCFCCSIKRWFCFCQILKFPLNSFQLALNQQNHCYVQQN